MSSEALEKLIGPLEPGVREVWSPATSLQAYAQYAQLQSRSLYLFGAISQLGSDEEQYEAVLVAETDYMVQVLRMLDAISSEPITIYINSVGGSIPAGMALIQTMRDLSSPVHTFVIGEAASMAAIVAMAGDKRFAFPAAQWLLHRGKFSVHGDREDLDISTKKAALDDLTADQVIVNFTKIPATKLETMQRKDKWMGVEEALKWGLIDEIVVPKRSPSADWKAWLPDRKRLKAKREKDEEEGSESE